MIVPLYGRYDFLKFQLALFANDPDLRSGRVELIYFVDDPRIIDQVVQLADNCYPAYGVPFVVATTGDNHGYAGANNLAASLARGKLLVLMNSDVFPKRRGWLREITAAWRSLPDCGVVGIKLLYHDECLQHGGMTFEAFPLWAGMHGNNHPFKGLPAHHEPEGQARSAEAVTGALLAIGANLYREVGGLCEDFVFGDFEDSELCLKVRHAGKRIWYLPHVEAYHLERQSQALVPDAGSWRWQLTVYNCWLQEEKWSSLIARIEQERTEGSGGDER